MSASSVSFLGVSCSKSKWYLLIARIGTWSPSTTYWCADTQNGEEQTSGSTATIVLARNDKVVVANVGDSRAVLSRSGQYQNLSTEHR